ncbi:MAG: hypothetical protein DRN07_00980 [Thermoplasmata archaeon]|nr:MAG: hypothetical protein DRN07_00980 [Thermoplasmata archaeon]
MNEQEIIAKLRVLEEIKPRRDWMKNTLRDITGQRTYLVNFNFLKTPAFSFAILMIVLVALSWLGLFNQPKSDDFKTAVLEIAENDVYDYNYYLEKASKVLEKAKTIDQTDKKSQVVKEAKEALEKAVEKLPSHPKNPKESGKIVEKVKVIKKNLAALGEEAKELTKPTKQLEEKTKEMIENEIYRIKVEAELAMLENRTLTDEQKELLKEAKNDYNNQDYLSALEKILQLTNQ